MQRHKEHSSVLKVCSVYITYQSYFFKKSCKISDLILSILLFIIYDSFGYEFVDIRDTVVRALLIIIAQIFLVTDLLSDMLYHLRDILDIEIPSE